MRVAVWMTGHEIADTVADAAFTGVTQQCDPVMMTCANGVYLKPGTEANIAYGVLRGAGCVFAASEAQSKPWVHIDRGYWRPGHYDGYYRVSLNGTQQTSNWPEPDYDRWCRLNIEVRPWRGLDESKPVLVCPPTAPVRQFFGYTGMDFGGPGDYGSHVIRQKGDASPINFSDYNYVLTFNSSVGWQALAAGIPCVSDATHSIVGTFFGKKPLAQLAKAQYVGRERLFATMAGLQMTLEEMRQGKLWPVVSRLMSS
jgi:hypothetical protein